MKFDKRTGPGRGLCELGVLGAINFLEWFGATYQER